MDTGNVYKLKCYVCISRGVKTPRGMLRRLHPHYIVVCLVAGLLLTQGVRLLLPVKMSRGSDCIAKSTFRPLRSSLGDDVTIVGDNREQPSCDVVHIATSCYGGSELYNVSLLVKSILYYSRSAVKLHIVTNRATRKILHTFFESWELQHVAVQYYISPSATHTTSLHYFIRHPPDADVHSAADVPDRLLVVPPHLILVSDVSSVWHAAKHNSTSFIVQLISSSRKSSSSKATKAINIQPKSAQAVILNVAEIRHDSFCSTTARLKNLRVDYKFVFSIKCKEYISESKGTKPSPLSTDSLPLVLHSGLLDHCQHLTPTLQERLTFIADMQGDTLRHRPVHPACGYTYTKAAVQFDAAEMLDDYCYDYRFQSCIARRTHLYFNYNHTHRHHSNNNEHNNNRVNNNNQRYNNDQDNDNNNRRFININRRENKRRSNHSNTNRRDENTSNYHPQNSNRNDNNNPAEDSLDGGGVNDSAAADDGDDNDDVILRGIDMTRHDVTVVTQLHYNRLPGLIALIDSWAGPMQVVMYLTDAEASSLRSDLARKPQLTLSRVHIHVVYKRQIYYPINILRNIGLRETKTDYVFVIDVDFLPMRTLHSHLLKLINYEETRGKKKRALIVPTFETFTSDYVVPSNKRDFIRDVHQGKVEPYHQGTFWNFKKGHRPHDYPTWFQAIAPYKVDYVPKFEPYIVLPTLESPLYPEILLERMQDKMTYTLEIVMRGFTMYVLHDAFMVHFPHAKSQSHSWAKDPKFYRCSDYFFDDLKTKLSNKYLLSEQ